jgi:hypothetical protein
MQNVVVLFVSNTLQPTTCTLCILHVYGRMKEILFKTYGGHTRTLVRIHYIAYVDRIIEVSTNFDNSCPVQIVRFFCTRINKFGHVRLRTYT